MDGYFQYVVKSLSKQEVAVLSALKDNDLQLRLKP